MHEAMSLRGQMRRLSQKQLAKALTLRKLLSDEPRVELAEILKFYSSFSGTVPAPVHRFSNLTFPRPGFPSSTSVPLPNVHKPASCNQTAPRQTSAFAWTSLLSRSRFSIISDGSGSPSAFLHCSPMPQNTLSIAQYVAPSASSSCTSNSVSSSSPQFSQKLRKLHEDLGLRAVWSSSSSSMQAVAEAGDRLAGTTSRSSSTSASASRQPAGSVSQTSDNLGSHSSDGSLGTRGQQASGAGAGAGGGGGGGGGGGKESLKSSSSSAATSGRLREEGSEGSSEGGGSSSGGGSGGSGNNGGGGSKGSGDEQSGGRSRWTRTGPVSWLSLVLLLVTGGALLLYFDKEKKERMSAVKEGPAVGQAAIGGPFELVRQDGKTVTEKDFMGNWTLLYFGFVKCPDICPAELTKLAAALEKVDATGLLITPVFISVDPERDTVELVKEYVEQYHPRLVGLTGSPEAVRQMARAFRVYYMKTNEGGDDYLVDHSIIMYLMDPNMQFVKFFAKNETVDSLAEGIVKHVREWKA